MKPKTLLIICALSALCSLEMRAQEKRGCDLCGPASGNTVNRPHGNYSATIGANCSTGGAFSLAVGNSAMANSGTTMALGQYVRANATNTVVIGSGIDNTESRALINNKPNSMMIGFNSTLPTLFISASTSYNLTGKVGIGNVTTPESKLHIKADENENAGLILEPSNVSKTAFFQIYDDKHQIMVSRDDGMCLISENDNLNINANNVIMKAKVAINSSENIVYDGDYALAVDGGILTNEVLIKEVTEWHDYVFDEDYKLMPIKELESFIKKYNHLPDIPSQNEVSENGYNVEEMDGLLLKKIEELTLYTIELNKVIEQQQILINTLLNQ